MPLFEVEDSDSGIKVLVEGDEEPDQVDAYQLVESEIKFLLDNLHKGPGNRFLLDVGPLYKQRQSSDELNEIQNRMVESTYKSDIIQADAAAAIEAANQTQKLWENKINSGSSRTFDKSAFNQDYTNILNRINARRTPHTPPIRDMRNATDETLSRIPENSLMLVSHGNEAGELSTETGFRFTLNNVSKIIGPESRNIHNMLNLACYGGKQCAQDYQAAFPNITNVVAASPANENTISVLNLRRGRFFMDESNAPAESVTFKKHNGKWVSGTNKVEDGITLSNTQAASKESAENE